MIYGTDELLTLARAYVGATGETFVGLGRKSCGNEKLFLRIAKGKSCNVASAQRAGNWFHENWPRDVAWPLGGSA